MPPKEETSYTASEIDQFFNTMNIIFYLMVCVPLLLFVLIFLDLQEKGGINPSFESTDSIYHVVLSLIVILIGLVGYFLYKKRLKILLLKDNLSSKLKVYKEAAIRKYFFLGIGCCIANALLFYFGEQIYLMAFALLLILFSVNRPTIYRVRKDVPLNKQEETTLKEYRKHL